MPPPQPTLKEDDISNDIPSPSPSSSPPKNNKKPLKPVPSKPPSKPPSTASISKPKHRKQDSRMNMLGAIQSFKAKNLKHVSAETLAKEAAEKPSNVQSLLQSTLKNYRQFVMDDDDSDDSDGDWDD